jgi:hypothetical protein
MHEEALMRMQTSSGGGRPGLTYGGRPIDQGSTETIAQRPARDA